MNWSVTWLPTAERTLTDLWVNAPDRQAVTDAANQIDRDLERNPQSAGESRDGDTRIHTVPPLTVLFDVDATARTVTVWAVWRTS
jgi:hypothetical protein